MPLTPIISETGAPFRARLDANFLATSFKGGNVLSYENDLSHGVIGDWVKGAVSDATPTVGSDYVEFTTTVDQYSGIRITNKLKANKKHYYKVSVQVISGTPIPELRIGLVGGSAGTYATINATTTETIFEGAISVGSNTTLYIAVKDPNQDGITFRVKNLVIQEGIGFSKLQDNIDSEAATRSVGDITLQANIDQEVLDRKDADQALFTAGDQLFNKDNMVVSGFNITSVGDVNPNASWKYTSIRVKDLTDLFIGGSTSGNGTSAYYRFTDASKNLLGSNYGSVNTVAGATLAIPVGAYYFEVNIYGVADSDILVYSNLMVNSGAVALPFASYKVVSINGGALEAKSLSADSTRDGNVVLDAASITEKILNNNQLFDKNSSEYVIDGKFVTSGGAVSSNASWKHARIPVYGLSNIAISGSTSAGTVFYYRFEDENQDLLGSEYGNATSAIKTSTTIPVPMGAYFFSLNIYTVSDSDVSAFAELMINSGTSALPFETFLSESTIEQILSKKLYCSYVDESTQFPTGEKLVKDSDLGKVVDRNALNKFKAKSIMDLLLGNFQKATTDYVAAIAFGQSLSVGEESCVPLSRSADDQYTNPLACSNYRGNVMLGNQVWTNYGGGGFTAFNNLVASISGNAYSLASAPSRDPNVDGGRAECPIIAAANSYKFLFDQHISEVVDRKVLAVSCGTGGKSIEQLSKECNNPNNDLYDEFTDALTNSKSVADGLSKTISCSAIFFCQGESNYAENADAGLEDGVAATAVKATYKGYLQTLHENMVADVKSAYGQEFDPIFVIVQTGDNYTQNFEVTIGQAQLEYANETDGVILATPYYFLPDNGGHRTSNGYRWMGEYLAKVFHHAINRNLNWTPVQPWRITRESSTRLILDFVAPVFPLVINTKIFPEKTSYGFKVKDTDGEKTLTVQVKDTYVILDCDSAMSGNVEVTYGSEGPDGGNICDSDTTKAQTNYIEETAIQKPVYEPLDNTDTELYGTKYPLQNWCVAFHYELAEGVNELEII